MEQARRVTVVGSFNVDHVWETASLPKPGETLAGAYRSGPGGKGFNQAVAAARAGAPTSFVCALGEDVGAQLARMLAAAESIDLRDRRSTAPTGTAGIFVDGDGANSIVFGAGANADLTRAFVEEQREALATSAIVLAQLESPPESVMHALQTARTAGVLAVLNPAPANAAVPRALLEAAALITPNETEFCALVRTHAATELAPSALARLDDGALHGHCRHLMPHGTVVLTLGAAGCFVSHPEAQCHGDAATYYRIAGETVTAIDTTGAGDAFNGALAASLAAAPELPFAAHVRFANRYAALSTETAGAALAMPHRQAVIERFGD